MRILLVHNDYLYAGGEEVVVQNEAELLEAHGNEVCVVRLSNTELQDRNSVSQLRAIFGTADVRALIGRSLARHSPEIIHVHNWMPRVTTAAFSCGRRFDVPVVQTLHNFRFVCLNGLLLRAGVKCELCVDKWPLWGVRYGCYRNSRVQSAGAALLQVRMRRAVSQGAGDALIAVSELQRRKLLEAQWIPEERTWVKPNFVASRSGSERVEPSRRKGLLFVGRLSREKGLHVVLQAMRKMKNPPPLTVLGDGPERAALAVEAYGLPVTFAGAVGRHIVEEFMDRSALLVLPAVWYEGMTLAVLEAMCSGLPVVVSDETGAAEAVGPAGWTVPAGDVDAWAEVLARAYGDLSERASRAEEGLRRHEKYYSPEASYRGLMEIYNFVLGRGRGNDPVGKHAKR